MLCVSVTAQRWQIRFRVPAKFRLPRPRWGASARASDLNPIACMLTWGGFNIVGAPKVQHQALEAEQQELVKQVKAEIDELGIEKDEFGWRGKVYLYCLEVTCPSSGWRVPVLPSLVVSTSKNVMVRLVPNAVEKSYDIEVVSGATADEMEAAKVGTYRNKNVVHTVNGVEHINSISAIRRDYSETLNGKRVNKNKLRMWDKTDVVYRDDDIFGERLYAIQWIKDTDEPRPDTEFRTVTSSDIETERKVVRYVEKNLADWQEKGWVPEVKIEPGEKTDEPIRTRGWTHWSHLFSPRQLLLGALFTKHSSARLRFGVTRALNQNCRTEPMGQCQRF